MSPQASPSVGADDGGLLERLAGVPYTGAIADALDELGLRSQVLPSSIRPLDPGMALAGRVLTARGEPTDSLDPEVIFLPFLRMLGAIERGDVLLIESGGGDCAHFGELSCEAVRARGAAGAVIDGGVRDGEYIRRQGLPVFARYSSPLDIRGRWHLIEYGGEISVGGVSIARGDYVVGDRDGVVVIPRHVAQGVVDAVEAVVSTEDLVRRDVINGADPAEAFHKHGRF